jgi:fibronectin type 3 domain-containing protein
MKRFCSAWITALFTATLLALAACGGNGGGTPDPGNNDQVWTGTAATSAVVNPGITGVPELPFDGMQTSHATSTETSQLELLGSEYLQQYHATVEGTGLHMIAPAEVSATEFPVAWGLYKFTGLNDYNPQWLNIECLPDVFGQEYYVAFADYTLGDWRWFGPVTFPEFQLDMTDLNHHVISALGNMYFIVVCKTGNGALLSKSTLTVEPGGGGDVDRLPGAPHHLTATDGEYPDRVVIDWEPGIGADSYKLWRKAPAGEWAAYADVNDITYQDLAVETDVHYSYKAVSVNTAGESGHSNIDEGWAGEGGGEGPGTPYDFNATDGEFEDHVLLTWSYDGTCDKFEIWRQAPGGDWESYDETTDLLYEDYEVEPGVHYNYKSWAWLNDERGEHSNIDEGWAGEDNRPGTPYDLVATDGEFEDYVLLTWKYDGDCDKFEIWRKAPDGDWGTYAEVLDGLTYEDTEVTPGVKYEYKVWAWIGEVRGDHGNIDEGWAGTIVEVPDTPECLAATDGVYTDKVVVEWTAVDGADHYNVWRRTGLEGEWESLGTELGNRKTDLTAELDVHYWYKVNAVNDNGESDFSNDDEGWAGTPPATTGSISVVILNGEGQPVPEVGVLLYGGEAPVDAGTNVDGVATFTDLPFGIYLVVPTSGTHVFDPLYIRIDLCGDDPDQEAAFTATESIGPLHRLRGVAYSFNGAVSEGFRCEDPAEDSRWQPLANTRMRITLIGMETHWDVYTDENGYYEQLDLPEGSFSIIPLLEGYTFSPELHDPVINGEAAPGMQNFRGYPAG